MSKINLNDLQADVQGKLAFTAFVDYISICQTFLQYIKETQPTRIVSPTNHNYIFYQYDQGFNHKITRPLNTDLFIENPAVFTLTLENFFNFLADLQRYQESAAIRPEWQSFIETREINKVVYTLQQSIGCIGDSFLNPNQSRKAHWRTF